LLTTPTLKARQQDIVWNTYVPWAHRVGNRMTFGSILNVYYEKEWDTPLIELQRRLKLEAAPKLPKLKKLPKSTT